MTSDTVPQSTATLWADNFFAYFNLFFPILSRPHFMHQLVTQPQKMDPLLRNAVFAIGSHYTKHVHETDCVSRQFFNQCRSMLHLSSGKPTLSSLQALVIMCWYSYLQDDMQTCSELRLTLIACLRELNLGCDPGTSLDTVNVELRRRAFWTSYVIDQWLTVCTGHRLMSLRREKWDCKWPQLEDTALQVTAFSQMIKLAQIMGDSHEPHQQPLEAALTEWLLNLPSYLEYGKSDDDTPPSPMAKIYRILYYTVQIMLHRPSFDHPNDFSRSICMTAANTIIHVAEQMHWHDQVRYLYNTFNTSLSLATSIHLDAVLHAGFDNVPARINLAKSVRLLKDTNCTLLPQPEFEHLLDHFL
ncbi:fungal-specific transcription factor domain-containing protein, partial [Radiomyces spectabilis]|uniref:fungal-specific transcription factor domain-containing protein n=1 Tax=Radiomyces spectabilis TaxID=64574 RepID=UPI002220A312